MKAPLAVRHAFRMLVVRRVRPARGVLAGALLALVLPGCVLSERHHALDSEDDTGADTSTGDAADMGRPSAGESGETTAAPPAPPHRYDTGMRDDEAVDTTGTDSSGGQGDETTSTGTDSSGGASIFGADCCEPQADPGCFEPDVEQCVCDADAYCCERAWDEVCADLAHELGCATCQPETAPASDDCCVATYAEGCLDTTVDACVCAFDPFCCDVQWDETCVQLVESQGCGDCQASSCCSASLGPGCAADGGVQACVCQEDPYCCSDAWDDVCVSHVEALGCGVCGGDESAAGTGTSGSGTG